MAGSLRAQKPNTSTADRFPTSMFLALVGLAEEEKLTVLRKVASGEFALADIKKAAKHMKRSKRLRACFTQVTGIKT